LPSDRYRRLRALAYALGAGAFVLAFFHRVAPGAIAADLRAAFGTSATALGFIAAFYFYPYAAMQLPSGMLADSIGPRRLFTAGCLVAGAGSLLFAFAPDVGWLLAGRALVGLGVAVAFVSVLKLIASWFSEREFATWVGVLQLLGNLGAVLGAYPLAWAAQYLSWRWAFVVTGVLSLGLAAAIWLGVRDSPRHAGLSPIHPESADPAARTHGSHWMSGLARVAGNGQTWTGFVMQFGLVGSYMTFAGLWAVPYLTDGLGQTRTEATLHVSVMILGFAFGSFVVGTLSDRMGRRLPLLRGLSALYLLCWTPWVLGWTLPRSLSLGAFVLMGVGMSCAVLSWALAKEHNPPALSGTATSFVNTSGFAGAALLQPLVGWILDLSAGAPALVGYRRAAGLLALVTLVGVVAAFRMRETRCRNVWAERGAR
jgi:MFS family permease